MLTTSVKICPPVTKEKCHLFLLHSYLFIATVQDPYWNTPAKCGTTLFLNTCLTKLSLSNGEHQTSFSPTSATNSQGIRQIEQLCLNTDPFFVTACSVECPNRPINLTAFSSNTNQLNIIFANKILCSYPSTERRDTVTVSDYQP